LNEKLLINAATGIYGVLSYLLVERTDSLSLPTVVLLSISDRPVIPRPRVFVFTPEAFQIVAGGRSEAQTTGSSFKRFRTLKACKKFSHPSLVRAVSTRDPVVYASLRPPATFSQTLRVANPPCGTTAPSPLRNLRNLRMFRLGLAKAAVTETRRCQYENTSNGDFLIDRHPAFKVK
jgi:hypothetical protein